MLFKFYFQLALEAQPHDIEMASLLLLDDDGQTIAGNSEAHQLRKTQEALAAWPLWTNTSVQTRGILSVSSPSGGAES